MIQGAGVVGVSGLLPRTVRPKRPCLFRGRRYGLSEPRSPKLLCVALAGVILPRTLSPQLQGPGFGSGEPQALLPYLDSDGQYGHLHGPPPASQGLQPAAESRRNEVFFGWDCMSVCVCERERERSTSNSSCYPWFRGKEGLCEQERG